MKTNSSAQYREIISIHSESYKKKMLCVCTQSVDSTVCQHANRLGIVHKECNIQISKVAVSTFVTSWHHCKHPNIRICYQCKMPVLIQELMKCQ